MMKKRFAQQWIGPDTLLFIALWIVAVIPGVLAVRGLTWPYNIDGLRDISAAQAIRDGRSPLADVFYPGELAWYSPLVPIVVAALSWLGGAGVSWTYVHAGPFLNALAPVAFYACARVLVGRWPALVAAGAFMFLPLDPPAFVGATYTSWLFPSAWAQSFLYLGILLWAYVLPSPTTRGLVLAGIATGVAFLSHGGAGILLAAIIGVTGLTWRRDGWRMVLVTGITAAAVSSPFLVPLLIRYHLHAANRSPNTWSFEPTTPRTALAGFANPWAILEMAFVVLGAYLLWKSVAPHVRRIILAWGGGAFLLYCYSVLTGRFAVPALMPPYHFFYQLRAWKWVLFGCGIVAVVTYARSRRVPAALVASVAGLIIGVLYHSYLSREAFTKAAVLSDRILTQDDELAYAWLRANTPPDAVILANENDSLRVVGPSGRFVISLPAEFSNPYLPWEPRYQARNRMEDAVYAGDQQAFREVQQQYNVSYVFWRATEPGRLPLKPVFNSGEVTLYDARVYAADTSRSH